MVTQRRLHFLSACFLYGYKSSLLIRAICDGIFGECAFVWWSQGFVLSAPQAEVVVSQPLPKNLRYQNQNCRRLTGKRHIGAVWTDDFYVGFSANFTDVYNSDMRQWRYEWFLSGGSALFSTSTSTLPVRLRPLT